MTETSKLVAFAHLFEPGAGTQPINRIEIPLIQRDFAQGRDDAPTRRIRSNFLDVLAGALVGESTTPVELDFIYGDVTSDDGVLRPLDGQQRLTTLFLLHWYLGYSKGLDVPSQPWATFSYATRASARLFCERIVEHAPPQAVGDPSSWIRDQAWFQYVWKHDSTIASMLTMITALHDRFAEVDVKLAWDRLTDHHRAAIRFHLLPIPDMGSPEKLYIKMNSRGKPLTDFENVKAQLESHLDEVDPGRSFAHKVDGAWTDFFWPYRGEDGLVDGGMLRYLEFVIESGEWRRGIAPAETVDARARELLTSDSDGRASFDQLFAAFDTWVGADIDAYFDDLFATSRTKAINNRVPLFGGEARTNLFEACIQTFGETRGATRVFTFGQQLLLSAVVAYRAGRSTEVDARLRQRIRVIRNLIDASENEIRIDRMPALLAEVESLALNGLVGDRTAFNRAQFDDEHAKAQFIEENPHLEGVVRRLEDHPLLRGSLVAFELNSALLEKRADAFLLAFESKSTWTAMTGALLAAGRYPRARDGRARSFQFGVGAEGLATAWRAVLGTGTRESAAPLREALNAVLDNVARSSDTAEALTEVKDDKLAQWERAQEFSWQYYVTKYEVMREGRSGIYFGLDGALGYRLCMLERTQLNSYYRDPFLSAIYDLAGVGGEVDEPWFTGYEWNDRWLTLRRSGARLRALEAEFVLDPPLDDRFADTFLTAAAETGARDGVIPIPQSVSAGEAIDSVDRVRRGAELLQSLVRAGL
ncbi:DUF262 domain-containing protein [Frigoribacterium sp. CFBP 8766]|uniref:DUF262 domain-containing protein n=1 Tax=Frigoribacterium sp. CFBP 8766 TaxID=2775273 RepID=UPI001785B2D5|nr:DUF262 domain-containing protein [Frigoribacterium sp. CFBP 8766]MBD8584143.1 DUF262 domain-containing protein [Frigoribacterium sp. CFBP 8766]